MSEKIRLFMAGSIGETTRKVFNGWSRSRQDVASISNKDEKSRRMSPDTSSSSSTSLSPSVLPTHTASPRIYKKTSISQLAPQRRSNSRQKAQAQTSPINNILSTIDDNLPTASPCGDPPVEQPSTCVEQDESKVTVTINVVDSLNQTEQSINDDTDISRESNCQIETLSDSHLNANTSRSSDRKFSPEHVEDHVDSWNGSRQNSVANGDATIASSSVSSTDDVSPILHKKNSNSRLKEHRRQNSRQKDQTVFVEQESDDGYQSDRNIVRQNSSENRTIEKNHQDSTLDESFIKSGHRRRKRRAKNSKNNNQQNLQREQQRPEQKSQKQGPSKQELVQHKNNELSRSRKSGDPVRSMSYPLWQKQLHVHQHSAQQQNELNKSLPTRDSAKTFWQKSMNQNPDTALLQSQQRSDQSPYFISVNRRNSVQTSNTAKVELNKNTAIFRESELFASSSSHSETPAQIVHPIDQLNTSMTRFTSYADVISPHNRHSSVTTNIPPNTNSLTSNEGKITTPAPTASVRNVTNCQWYSPFGSGLSIQFTPPAPPRDSHSQLSSFSKNSLFSSSSMCNSSPTISERHRSVIAPPPISAPKNASSMSMFTSSPLSTLNASSSNRNQLNSGNTLSTSPSSFRGTLFGKKHPILDKEKGELSDQEVEEGIAQEEQNVESSVDNKRISSFGWTSYKDIEIAKGLVQEEICDLPDPLNCSIKIQESVNEDLHINQQVPLSKRQPRFRGFFIQDVDQESEKKLDSSITTTEHTIEMANSVDINDTFNPITEETQKGNSR
ncbi:15659_t:CDS:2 [Acaulospora colombiana]|uniref:15659_t:CDS:1 n=1 Tax=Acaulospora colombiana TaxID=27376 RepID=A0ACA9L2L8_9GLOM|nr:15659_t:CDS:2 [Acaulospora colombiana]